MENAKYKTNINKYSFLLFLVLFLILLNINECNTFSSFNNKFNKIRGLSEKINNAYNLKKARINTYSYNDDAEELKIDEYIFQLTTSLNELNAIKGIYPNTNGLSMIDLDKCKDALNKNNLPLIILKFEKLTNISYEKNILYEIYDPTNKNKLDLSLCENNSINLYIPININNDSQFLYEDLKKNDYNIFDINDPFYQDICTQYKSKDNTDVPLSDRRKDYYIKESFPQSNCEYANYTSDKKYLQYTCKVDKEGIDIEKIDKFSDETALTKFYKNLKNLNILVLKCYKLAFNFAALTKNFGNIISFVLIILNIILAIVSILKGISPLRLYIAKFIFEKPKAHNKENLTQINVPPKKRSKTTIIKKPKLQNVSENGSENNDNNNNDNNNNDNNDSKDNNNDKEDNYDDNLNNYVNRRKKKKAKTLKKNSSKTNNYMRKGQKSKTQSTKRKVNENTKNEFIENKIEENKILKEEKLDDYELNNLEFNKAIELDNRGYCRIYYSILKREHILFFTFFSWNDYNLIYIKFARFFFLLSTLMGMNVFFFFDKSLHELYLNKGKFDFVLLIPQIILSSLVSHVSEVFICFLTMTDKYVYQFKTLEENDMNKSVVMKSLKCVKIKLISFFIFIFILMIVYWYLISSFCAVYENTQITFLMNFAFSFLLYLIYPLFIYILTSLFKFIGLKTKSSCLYKLGNIIPIF